MERSKAGMSWDTTPRRRLGKAWFIWGFAALLYVVALFHRMSLGVASLQAMQRFHVNAGALATFTALQLCVYGVMQIPSGILADRWGPRRMLTLGMLFMALGEGFFAVTTSMSAGLIARGLVGLGDALIFLNVLRLALSWFPANRYALLAALTGFAGGLGQLLTTVPLQVVLHRFGWTTTFADASIVTVLLAGCAWLVLRDRPASAAKGHAPSEDAATGASPLRQTLRSVGHDLRAALAQPGTRRGFWTHFTLAGPFTMFTALWGFSYLAQSQGRGGSAASALLAVAVVTYVAASPCVGWIARQRRWRDALALAVSSAEVCVWGIAVFWPGGRLPDAALLALLIVNGIGTATSAVAFDIAREANPPARGGTASGIVNVGGFSAATLSALAVGLLLDLLQPHSQTGSAVYGPVTFAFALVPLFLLVVLGWFQIVRLSRQRR